MNWFKRKLPKRPEQFEVARCEFLGEQDGAPEQILKERLADFFQQDGSVERAYLARVSYGEERDDSVVLGLITQSGPDKGLVEKVGAIFAAIFNVKEHLDTMFLTGDQEIQIMKVCKPFFMRG